MSRCVTKTIEGRENATNFTISTEKNGTIFHAHIRLEERSALRIMICAMDVTAF